jgi:hypothetical protein
MIYCIPALSSWWSSLRPCLSHPPRRLQLTLSLASLSAPAAMSAATASVWPFAAAINRAVSPPCGGWIQRERRRGAASAGASAASALSPVCELASARAWRAPCLSAHCLHCCSRHRPAGHIRVIVQPAASLRISKPQSPARASGRGTCLTHPLRRLQLTFAFTPVSAPAAMSAATASV